MKAFNECKIYYAHSKLIYGTSREAEELGYIKRKYPRATIINPAGLKDLTKIKEFLKIVGKCNLVVVSEYSGFIGKGALVEIARAFSNDIPVKVIRTVADTMTLSAVSGFEIINAHDWKIRYALLNLKY
jgi:hypothetical protein